MLILIVFANLLWLAHGQSQLLVSVYVCVFVHLHVCICACVSLRVCVHMCVSLFAARWELWRFEEGLSLLLPLEYSTALCYTTGTTTAH